ncbi:hypothetical protein C8A05DRAFT_18412 [Staphylotrichum tortipilum]|uniref:Uncharacterized protein n=1 Tax=Staphylotrichum tortipilum TaxID=2831512 RepID=A0AAN6ME14_9PEZI|nr:hypothetical protein C8A05DRAFT_18412 [Staphylotrichum longicolle]
MARDIHLPPPAVAGNAKAKKPAFSAQFVTRKAKSVFQGIFDLTFKSDSPSTSDEPASSVAGDHEPETPAYPVTEADVLEHVNMHQKFRLPTVEDIELTDLPSFDDFTQYGKITEDTQRGLWAKEVSRLVNVINSKDALSFQGSDDLDVDSIKAHEIFTNLADRFLQSLSIISFDGECLTAEHEPVICQVGSLERSHVTLNYLCNKEEEDDVNKDDESATRLEDLFAFIDYCTAVLARIMYAQSSSKEAAHRLLSHLAKLAAKAKVVSVNPEECARISIDTGISDDELAALKRHNDPRGMMTGLNQGPPAPPELDTAGWAAGVAPTPGRGGDSAFGRGGAFDDRWGVISKKGAVRHLYFAQVSVFRFGLIEILMHLTVRVRGDSRLMRVAYSNYEISAIVYTTGFGSFQTLVFQDRDTNLDGFSEQSMVDGAGHAFGQLNGTVRQIKEASTGTGTAILAGHPDSIGTQMTWAYSVYDAAEPDHQPSSLDLYVQERVQLRSMSSVISVMVPLLFASPKLVGHVRIALETVLERDLLLAPHKALGAKPKGEASARYTASFCLDTLEHRTAQSKCGEKDSKSLSNSLIRRNGLLSGKVITEIGRVDTLAGDWSAQEEQRRATERRKAVLSQIKKNQAELEAASNVMKTWVLEEKGVMVQCKFYVSSVMAACAVLIAGGIAVGITVGERITGVDPFNITTYCWVLAGFLVIVAKSVRVHEWPWNDFLHGRVLCKSVSELSSITGMHSQLIIAYLLECEDTSFLETRGPFHITFHRKADDGFSIDVPLSMWTLLLSGLIMIEVESTLGRSLVCLDLRKGTAHSEVNAWYRARQDDRNNVLCCPRLKDQSTHSNTSDPRVRLAYAKGMSWSRMIGVYGNNKAVYV